MHRIKVKINEQWRRKKRKALMILLLCRIINHKEKIINLTHETDEMIFFDLQKYCSRCGEFLAYMYTRAYPKPKKPKYRLIEVIKVGEDIRNYGHVANIVGDHVKGSYIGVAPNYTVVVRDMDEKEFENFKKNAVIHN